MKNHTKQSYENSPNIRSYPGSVFHNEVKRRTPKRSSRLVIAVCVCMLSAAAICFILFLRSPLSTRQEKATAGNNQSMPQTEQTYNGNMNTDSILSIANETTNGTISETETPPAAADANNQPDLSTRNLVLVNGGNALPNDFDLTDLICLNDIAQAPFTVKGENTLACRPAAEALTAMLAAAKRDGLAIWQVSEGYRSIDAQQKIWDESYNKYLNVNGLSEKKALEATARRVAKPGYSEHHTGLALDISVPGASFRHTEQSVWLAAHCWDYGFILRYTAEKEHITGIVAEPWHIRYVGMEAAKAMRDEGLCLEEYVVKYMR